MKIVALMGSQRKNGSGQKYMTIIEKTIKSISDAEFEYIYLSDYEIQMCKGCMICYEKGEMACPLKDAHLQVLRRIHEADAVVFYSPTYTLSISGMMKNFFDRSSFILHRPLFKGKYAMLLSAVGAYGDKQALNVLKTIVSLMGFRITGILGIANGKYAKNQKYSTVMDERLKNEAIRLTTRINCKKAIMPTIFELIAYNYQKMIFGADSGGCKFDKQYWKNTGWSERKTEYYYKINIPLYKKLLSKTAAGLLVKCGFIPL